MPQKVLMIYFEKTENLAKIPITDFELVLVKKISNDTDCILRRKAVRKFRERKW